MEPGEMGGGGVRGGEESGCAARRGVQGVEVYV